MDRVQTASTDRRNMPRTLLPQLFGLYTVQHDGHESHWIIMKNVFGTGLKVHEKYDLKGSTHGRTASVRCPYRRAHGPPPRPCGAPRSLCDDARRRAVGAPSHAAWGGGGQPGDVAKGYGTTWKCNDFRRDWIERGRAFSAHGVMDELDKDVAFLVRHRLIDYSLLLGVHHRHAPPLIAQPPNAADVAARRGQARARKLGDALDAAGDERPTPSAQSDPPGFAR